MTMIEPRQPTRRIHPFGVSINHIRYWTAELQDFVGDRRDYEVRYDPMNMARAFICLRGEWLEMYATSPIVREYTESGIDDGLVELMARAVKTSREYRSVPIAYARFLLACKRDEEFLSEQQSLMELDEDNDAPPSDDEFSDFVLPPSTELFELHTTT